MEADGPPRRRKRWLAGPLAIAVALVILTVAVGVLGGGKPGSGNQPAPGFPQGEPGFPHATHTTKRTVARQAQRPKTRSPLARPALQPKPRSPQDRHPSPRPRHRAAP